MNIQGQSCFEVAEMTILKDILLYHHFQSYPDG